MAPSTPKGSDPSPDLLVELVEILDAHGLAGDSYQLHDAVDVDALEQLLASSTGDVEIRLTVEGVQLVITHDGVDVLLDESNGAPDQ
ncbi:HalOD1 output domain-containing protein [Halorarum halobium]|uniref:HalOD1 output domain-containing protein n=1 Tax=Halorarum halobium TaxID=3075121 RepID=UPI0028AB4F84|nr:HalOD1 output domain-containing protein [Halobaculum sp. XH14]